MRAALLGFPQSGKTTLFQILTGVESAPGRRTEDQIGVVRVPDPRLDQLRDLFQPKKTTPASHEILDPATPFPRTGPRETTGDKDPYPALRSADLLVAVVRAFSHPAVAHASGSVDPERDRKSLLAELVLSDLVLVDTRLERIEKLEKVGKKTEAPGEKALLSRLHRSLEEGVPIRSIDLSKDEAKAIRGYGFLSHKPLLTVYNHGEGERPELAPAEPGFAAVALAARAEHEVLGLPPEERGAFREELGLGESGLDLLLRSAQELLGLLTFFTAGPPEVRAWQVTVGSSVVEAAGKIHSDLARGFIRAEVVPWDRLVAAGTWAQARERGWMQTFGREDRVREGDCLLVLFKV